MLVTCLKCKKPVFVSSAALGADEASVPCNACHASLLVSESGSVRLADGRRAPPTREDDPPAERGTFPVQKPRVGIGSFGENESLTVGGGEWIPQRPDDLPASAPPPVPEDANAVSPVPPPIPEDADAAPPVPPPVPEDADAVSPVPPPIPEDADAAPPAPSPIPEDADATPPIPARGGHEQTPGKPARTGPPLPPVPVDEAREQAAPDPAAQQDESSAAFTAPLDEEALAKHARARAEHAQAREPMASALGATQPLATPEPATPEPVAPLAAEAPESLAARGSESPVEEPAGVGPSHANVGADEPPAVHATVESWTVASSPFRGPVEEIRRDVDVSGRAGTVPLDERTFRREASRGKARYVAAAAVILVAASSLWAAGVVPVPGLPVPIGLQGLFESGDEPVAPGPNPAPAVAIEAPQQPAAPAPEPPAPSAPEPDRPEPDRPEPAATTAEPQDLDAQEPTAVAEDEPAEDVAGHRRGRRRRRGAGGPHHKGEDQTTEESTAPADTAEPGTPAPPDPPAAAPPVAEVAAAPAAVLHYKQGNLYLREKKVALAIDELKKAVAINPSYGVAYRSLGVAYMLLGREKSAVKSYERFVATEPSHRDAAKVREIIADYYRRNPR